MDDKNDKGRTLRQVLTLIEQLRYQRRDTYSKQPHPENKRFTQEELDAVVYHSYKNALKGRTQRLPSRETLINIATYLECSPEERNALLLAAHYLPLPLSAPSEHNLLSEASTLIHTVPFPAYTINQCLSIDEANQYFLDLCGITGLQDIPADRRTELHLVFDPHLSLQSRLSPSEEIRRANLHTAVIDWRDSYQSLQYERSYQETVEQLHSFPGFETMWKQSSRDQARKSYIYTITDNRSRQPIQRRMTMLSIGDNPFPKIAVYLPHPTNEAR
ncbi:MAG: hypothetical protein AAGF95_23940 [Chloroflexota bacterium]